MRPLRWCALALVLTACASETTSDSTTDDTTTNTAPTPPTTTTVDSFPTSTTTATTAPGTSVPPPTISSTAPATTAPATTSTAVDPRFEPLVGRWAHYDVVAYEDGTLKTLIISYGFNDFDVADGQLIDQGSFCFSEQRTDQPIETSLSDAATQAIEPPPTPVTVEEIDDTLRITRLPTPTPVGIELADPANEPLPDDPDDPRIVDDDGDGKPGITVNIRVSDELTGELYIARREIFAYEAYLVDQDTLQGTVTDDSEQLVIGASDPVFDMATEWVQYPDPARNPIILKRVDADWDCDRLAAERDQLFPPTPEVDW
ncbi:MAG: hypothetical protein CL424_01060 [Acidimicrobiaceae bacterium]|nr:hypothetical protein [Acidimicrobiaceae bacterium]